MLLSPGLLLLLLSGLQAVIEAEEVRALVGSDVKLSCVYPGTDRFDLDDLFVYWQVSESNAVVTYYLPENSSTGLEDSHYKNRAHLSLDSMQQGDFSLHLRNVTPQDEQKFKCLVFRKSLELGRILEAVVTLHVADGYPRPSVYWINKTDNSQLDQALHNDTVSLNQRGLYDVVSVLRIPWAPSVNVGCCIENALLHQNLTGTETFIGPEAMVTDSPARPHQAGSAAVLSALAVLLAVVIVAVATGCLCRTRCPRRSYTGARFVR
ncbi:ICOS ligand isoform X2 [Urocitellus parryii]|uniref:ICOS ligand isoform X2 n=1 Tax=Urocitellus parryii TaxID=9999 RepID=UPI000E55B6D4|nr:ICOS ligand isoform X2 [Urocitellus parryii]